MKVIITLLLVAGVCFSQTNFGILTKVDAPFLSFRDIQRTAEQTLRNSDYNLELTSEFPTRPLYNFYLGFVTDSNNFLGAGFFYHSTGLTLHYEDYSGEYINSAIINQFGTALTANFYKEMKNNLVGGYGFDLGYMFKEYKFSEEIIIAEESVRRGEFLKENSLFFRTNLSLGYKYKAFVFGATFTVKLDFMLDPSDYGKEQFENFSSIAPGLFVAFYPSLFLSNLSK